MSRLFSRNHKSEQVSAVQAGSDAAVFNSAGIASVTSANEFTDNFSGIELVGEPGLYWDIATAGNASLVVTVPAGKYWKLISAVMRITADANAANRIGVALTRDGADATIKTLTQTSAVTANQDLVRHFIYGTDDNVRGNNGVASQGTLTIAEPVTTADPFVINGTTFTILAALTGAANEILLGADEAATKVNLNAAFGTRTGVGNLHSVSDAVYAALECTAIDFAGDDMVFTANVEGVAGDSIDTTETFTHGSNVFDAATLGTTTAGVDQAHIVSDIDYPTSGCYLIAAEDIVFSVTAGVAGDNFEVFLSYEEFDDIPV